MEMNKQSMYKVARGFFSDMTDIEDVMSDTIMTCWMKVSTVRSPEYFKTWITKILINKCCDIFRKRKYFISLDELPNLQGVEMVIEARELEAEKQAKQSSKKSKAGDTEVIVDVIGMIDEIKEKLSAELKTK